MGTSPATVAATAAPAPKLNAIQIIEQEVVNYARQREQAIANVHAIEGAIQAAQHLLAKLKSEAAKAENEVKTELEKVETAVEGELKKL